jgi:hypothetical protein
VRRVVALHLHKLVVNVLSSGAAVFLWHGSILELLSHPINPAQVIILVRCRNRDQGIVNRSGTSLGQCGEPTNPRARRAAAGISPKGRSWLACPNRLTGRASALALK